MDTPSPSTLTTTVFSQCRLRAVWSQPLQADSGGSDPPSLQQLLMLNGRLLSTNPHCCGTHNHSNCGSVQPCIAGYPFRCYWRHSKHKRSLSRRCRSARSALRQAGTTASSTTRLTAIPLRVTGTVRTQGVTPTARLTAGRTRAAMIAGSNPARSISRRRPAVVRCHHDRLLLERICGDTQIALPMNAVGRKRQ